MEYRPGDDYKDWMDGGVDCVVNPVNCKGVMGAGLALAFKKRFPAIDAPYRRQCQMGVMRPGMVQLIGLDRQSGERRGRETANMVVANLATKDDWRQKSRLAWVDEGLGKLAGKVSEMGLKSIAIPRVGAGLGGLDWGDVQESVERHFRPLAAQGVRVVVCGEDRERRPRAAAGGRESEAADPEPGTPAEAGVPAAMPEAYKARSYYAGIGARNTSEADLAKMRRIAAALAREGAVLRSGAAEGADSAFEAGCDSAGGAKEIFLPSEGFQGRRSNGADTFCEITPAHEREAERFHPQGRGLKGFARLAMARNASQISGRDLATPASLVVCWTEGGAEKGGTGQALRMARDRGVPVLNLGDERVRGMNGDALGRLAGRMLKGDDVAYALAAERARARDREA